MAAGRGGGTMAPYQVGGVWYRPRPQPDYDAVGVATWYGAQYHNRRTADGELFDMDRASAAHTTLPLPCIVEVTNLENGRRLRLRVNDRGPFVAGRILDVSRQAARELGFYERGSVRVRVRYVGPAPEAAAPGPPKPILAQSTAVPTTSAAVRQAIQWQAGAFADRANAERAASLFRAARIEPIDRPTGRLWRVLVTGEPDETARDLQARIRAALETLPPS